MTTFLSCSYVGPYILFSRKFSKLSIAKGCDVFRSVRADMNKHAKCVHSTKGTFWHRNRLPFVFGSPSTGRVVRVNVATVMLLLNIMLLKNLNNHFKGFRDYVILNVCSVSIITDWKRYKQYKLKIVFCCQNNMVWRNSLYCKQLRLKLRYK